MKASSSEHLCSPEYPLRQGKDKKMRKSIVTATFGAALTLGLLATAPAAHALRCDQITGATAQLIQTCWDHTKAVCDEELRMNLAQPDWSQAQAQQTYAKCLNDAGVPGLQPAYQPGTGGGGNNGYPVQPLRPPTDCGGYGVNC
jgi:hypothetical protein